MASGVVDGALIVDTGIKNDKAKVGAKEFVSMIDKMTQTVNRAGQQMSSSVGGYVQAMNRARDAAKSMAGDQKAVAQEIIKTQTRLTKLEEKQALQRRKFEEAKDDAIGKAQEKFMQDNTGADFMPWEDEAQAMEQLSEDLNAVAQQAAETFGVFEDTAAFRNTSTEIEFMREKLAGLKEELAGASESVAETAVQTSGMSSGMNSFGAALGIAVGDFLNLAGSAGHAAASLARMAGSGALSFLKKLAEGAKNAAIQFAKLAANAMKSGIKRLGSMIGGAAKSLLGFNRASQQSSGGLKQGLMTMMKYGLGIRSLFFLFRKLRTVASEGLGELSKRNPAVKASIDSLKGALNGLKGSLATAFAPIVTAVAPALTTLINMLTSAINAIGAFMAALTGQGTYQKAVAGLEATGGAASGAAGSVKELKRQLAGFDQMEILSGNDSSSGGGGGGGGSGSGFSYETEEIGSGITDFVAKLKEMWANADYEGIGKEIAGCINNAFAKAKDLISWDNLGEKITEVVTGITGIFNGLVDGIDWNLIGSTFGDGIDTIVKTVNLLLTNIKWESIGKGFADGLNGLIDTVDWDELGQLFANKLNALIGTIKGLVTNFKWGNAGTAFATTLNSLISTIKWDDLSSAASTGINSVITALKNVVKGFKWGQVGTTFAETVNGVLDGISWTDLSTTASEGINGAVNTLKNIVLTFKWGKAGTTFAETVNGIFSGTDWEKLGVTASKSIGGPLKALKDAVLNFNFGEAATSFAETVNGFFSNEQLWADAGTIVSESIKGLFTWGADFLNDLDTEQIATDIKTFMKNVDWAGIARTVWDLFVAAFNAIGNLMVELIFGKSKTDKAGTIDEINHELESLGMPTIEVDVRFNLDLNNPQEEEWYNELQQSIQDSLREGEWIVPIDPSIPEDSVQLAYLSFVEQWNDQNPTAPIEPELPDDATPLVYQEFVRVWNKLHPEAPIDPTLPDNAGKVIEDEWAAQDTDLDAEVDLTTGDVDSQALDFLNAEDKTVKTTENLKDGQMDATAKTVMNASDKTVATTEQLKKDGSNWNGDADKALKASNKTAATTEQLKKDGGNWNSDADKALKANNKTAATTEQLKKDGGNWNGDADKALKASNKTVATTEQLKKDSKNWNSDAAKAMSASSKTAATTVQVKKDSKNWNKDAFKVLNSSSTVTKKVKLELGSVASKLKDALKKIGIKFATGGIVTAGGLSRRFASGGVIRGGMARYLESVPHYAAGTARAHGTVFVAGEAGPEIMGHINGRTEILNKSQLAEAIYSAVVAGMGRAVNALGSFLAGRMADCADAIVATIGNVGDILGLPDLSNLQFRAPAMATGTVLPYEVAAQVAKSGADIQNTLDANNEDLIQTIISVAGQIVAAVQSAGQGDRQGVGGGMTPQQVIEAINRRTQMFGASPLK